MSPTSAYTTTTGKANPNAVTFDAVTTTALKLDMTGQAVDGGYASVAVAEWEVAPTPANRRQSLRRRA